MIANGIPHLTITNLIIDVMEPLGNGYFHMCRTLNNHYIGRDIFPVKVGEPRISLPNEENILWINSDKNKIFPTITITNSEISLLDEEFSLVLYDTDISSFIEFDSNLELFQNIKFSPDISPDSIQIDDSNKMITFSNFQYNIDSILTIQNIPISFGESVYEMNSPNELLLQNIRLSVGKRYEDNYTETDESVVLKPSLFFTVPLFYRKDDQDYISFYLKENFMDLDQVSIVDAIENIYLEISPDTFFIGENLSFETVDVDSLFIDDSYYSNLININFINTKEYVQELNLALDRLTFSEEEHIIRMVNLNGNEMDITNFTIYPGLDPMNFYFNVNNLDFITFSNASSISF